MKKSLAETHPFLIQEWSDKNLPLTPAQITYGSNKRVWWKGACGHEWLASPKSRTSGEKCPYCAGKRVLAGYNDLASLYPDLAIEWSQRNKDLRPEGVTAGSHKKVWWKGVCGHEWQAVVKNRVQGAGCPYCSSNRLLPGFNDLATKRPELADEWSDRNLSLKPSDVMEFTNRKAWWRCRTCGNEWETLVSIRSGGSQCPYCSGIRLLAGFNDLGTTHPGLAAEWSEKNGRPGLQHLSIRRRSESRRKGISDEAYKRRKHAGGALWRWNEMRSDNALEKMRTVLQEDEKELQQMTEGFLLKLENMTDDEFREAIKG